MGKLVVREDSETGITLHLFGGYGSKGANSWLNLKDKVWKKAKHS
jgi:hypothetical protein